MDLLACRKCRYFCRLASPERLVIKTNSNTGLERCLIQMIENGTLKWLRRNRRCYGKRKLVP